MPTTMPLPKLDETLIARYGGIGPRYTSYPTALQFSPDFGEPALRAVIAASNEEPVPQPLSLYVHIPFCQSPCFYCGCNRVITRDPARAQRYLAQLTHEIELTGALFDADRPVRQLHLGGGTPNFLSLGMMAELMEALARHYTFALPATREFGIEIDPRHAERGYVRGLARLGFNRLSIGIQDFDLDVQQAVNRIQSEALIHSIMETARESNFRSISVDLIYGLPRQKLDSFARTLAQVIALAPDRIAVYGYAHLPHLFKAQSQIHAEQLPDASLRLQLFALALKTLTDAGYIYIGMDHFARPEDDLVRAQRLGNLQRNFQGYSTAGECDIIGLGVSAISRIGDSYSQNSGDLNVYAAQLDAAHLPVVRGIVLTRDDLLRREVINSLMCHGELDMLAFGNHHRIQFADYFASSLVKLEPLAADGLVELKGQCIHVTAPGRLLLRCIAMCFDKYLQQAPHGSKLI